MNHYPVTAGLTMVRGDEDLDDTDKLPKLSAELCYYRDAKV